MEQQALTLYPTDMRRKVYLGGANKMAKKDMINDSKEIKGEGVLSPTLAAYEEYDMNVMNDPQGSHKNLDPKPNK